MPLTIEERIEVILLVGNRSTREAADLFNQNHPEREPISFSCVAKLLNKFKDTGSVHDKPRCGPPRRVSDEETSVAVLGAFRKSPTKSIRRLSSETNLPKSSIHRILKLHKWHPYKLHLMQKLSEDDPDRRLEFCSWAMTMCEENDNFPYEILFTDEANFYVSGEVNKQNTRYWSPNNPYWFDETKVQGSSRLMVWCGIWKDQIVGPFFFEDTVRGENYLIMLRTEALPSLPNNEGPTWFQQDGAPAHYSVIVRDFLNEQFPGHWIGRRGTVEWSPRSPDLSPLDFYLWGHLKAIVYSEKIRDLQHLRSRIQQACQQITPDIIHRVMMEWRYRLELCAVNSGEHFEHIL